ncbi:MAG: hypothetical protein HYW07_17800 [Candidatus Latescibacteria bacterium]|nr:hypothetical protein [Candidatus Latescibacterota bacterium]
MANREAFLEGIQEELAEVLKPYQQRLSRRQRLADLVQQCIHCAGRDDFFQLDELLRSKVAEEVEKEAGLKDSAAHLAKLRQYAAAQVERYRLELIEDLRVRAAEAELPIEIDFPRFYVLKGIEGSIDFHGRQTVVNRKTIKSVDPRRIIAAVRKVKQQLYDRPYDPRAFIDGLYQTYAALVEKEGVSPGDPVPMQRFYLEHVISLQSKAFFQDMDKGRFKGYGLDQFAVDLWRYFQAGTGGTAKGRALQLRPGRNQALWLIDGDGERRQITAISFHQQRA